MQATLLEQQEQAEAAAEAYRDSIEQLKKSPEHTPEVRTVQDMHSNVLDKVSHSHGPKVGVRYMDTLFTSCCSAFWAHTIFTEKGLEA